MTTGSQVTRISTREVASGVWSVTLWDGSKVIAVLTINSLLIADELASAMEAVSFHLRHMN